MSELVSIIIPVYKVEKYLSECIESIIHQTYKEIEILLIDDGSPDNSGKICDEYAKLDNRIKVIHKNNGGVSSARNFGLDIAKGEYITFIDSDDFVDPNYVKLLYDNLKKHNTDLSFCAYSNYVDGKFEERKEKFPSSIEINCKDDLFINFFFQFFEFKNYIMGSIWRVLYKKNIIKKIRFNENIKCSEDLVFLINALFSSHRICYTKQHLYFYRLNPNSILHTYKKNYLKSQMSLYNELKVFFDYFNTKKAKKLCNVYFSLLAYYLLANEIKFLKKVDTKDKIREIQKCELYYYFKFKNGIKIDNFKYKIKFLIIWALVKFKLV